MNEMDAMKEMIRIKEDFDALLADMAAKQKDPTGKCIKMMNQMLNMTRFITPNELYRYEYSLKTNPKHQYYNYQTSTHEIGSSYERLTGNAQGFGTIVEVYDVNNNKINGSTSSSNMNLKQVLDLLSDPVVVAHMRVKLKLRKNGLNILNELVSMEPDLRFIYDIAAKYNSGCDNGVEIPDNLSVVDYTGVTLVIKEMFIHSDSVRIKDNNASYNWGTNYNTSNTEQLFVLCQLRDFILNKKVELEHTVSTLMGRVNQIDAALDNIYSPIKLFASLNDGKMNLRNMNDHINWG